MDEREEEGNDKLAAQTKQDRAGRSTGFVTGLFLGAVIGAGIALLVAPDSGRATRQQLGRRLRAMRKDAARGLERAEAHARRQLRRRRWLSD